MLSLALSLALSLMGCGEEQADPALAGDLCEIAESAPDGAELFARTWVPFDPRVPGGDGLGPVSNASSCAACHNQGGLGGAGGNHANVRANPSVDGSVPVPRPVPIRALNTRQLRRLAGTGVVDGGSSFGFAATFTRSTPALFGAGLIDAIPEGELLVAEVQGVPGRPEITGRVGRDAEGRVSRFGWKGQTATLAAFVENACANELGLETAAVRQPGPEGPGLDMDEDELSALVRYVAALPAPVELPTPGAEEGKALFVQVGCESCHRERMGEVQGLYSDLLLHDLGEDLGDAFMGYGGRQLAATTGPGARAEEWRTTPLWGLRDSAPYLHDGRARTLTEAIEQHGGEASRVIRAWRKLPQEDKALIERFLLSLAAPGAA